jgi:Protein of unknown function (DUF3908)
VGNLSFNEFASWVSKMSFQRESDNYRFEYALLNFRELFSEDDIKIFYPQNLFVDEKETVLLFFMEDKLVKLTIDENKARFKTFKYTYMKFDLEVFKESGYENAELTIVFPEEEFKLNGWEDTNTHWRYKYVQMIKEIYKFLLTK